MQNLVGIDSAITVLCMKKRVCVWIFFMHLFVIHLFFGATGHSLWAVLTFNGSNDIFHNCSCLLGLFDIGAYLVVKSPNYVPIPPVYSHALQYCHQLVPVDMIKSFSKVNIANINLFIVLQTSFIHNSRRCYSISCPLPFLKPY